MAKTIKIIETENKTELYELINGNWILTKELKGEYVTIIKDLLNKDLKDDNIPDWIKEHESIK